MKSLIKQFLPPILLKPFKRSPPMVTYDTYQDALNTCSKDAYENSDVVKAVIKKTKIYSASIQTNPVFDISALRTLIGLGLVESKDVLNVLDFGGAGGYHYFIAKAAFGNRVRLKWNVIETPSMVKEAGCIADEALKFYSSVNDAKKISGPIDLIFTSGALQYCLDPLSSLRELTEVGSKYIFITRTPFNDSSKNIISTQPSRLSENGPGPLPEGFTDCILTYPITFASKTEIERILSERYEIVFKIDEGKNIDTVENIGFKFCGYFCILK